MWNDVALLASLFILFYPGLHLEHEKTGSSIFSRRLLGIFLMGSSPFDVGPEHSLFLLQLGLQLGIGPPHGLDLEQEVDLLQWYTARLGHEEERKKEGKKGQRCKEKVHAVAHGGEHLLGKARHEEVEEPVAGGRGATGE